VGLELRACSKQHLDGGVEFYTWSAYTEFDELK